MITKKTIEILLTAKNMLGKGLNAGTTAINGFVSGSIGMLGRLKDMIFSLPALITTVFTGLAARAIIKPAMDLEVYKVQFKTLLGSLDAAQKRIDELTQFAANTPFQLPGIIKASKVLETLTKGALSTGAGLEMVGDTAAGVGAPIEELAVWFGRLYDGLKSGRPVGEAMARLQELGIVSGDARAKLEQLTASGASFSDKWAVVSKETSRFTGLMKEQSATADGLISTLKDNFSLALAEIGTEILPLVSQAVKDLIKIIADLKKSGELKQFGKDAADVLFTLFGILKSITGFIVKNREIIANLGMTAAGIIILNKVAAAMKMVGLVTIATTAKMAGSAGAVNILTKAMSGLNAVVLGLQVAFAGWQLGKLIADVTGLKDAIVGLAEEKSIAKLGFDPYSIDTGVEQARRKIKLQQAEEKAKKDQAEKDAKANAPLTEEVQANKKRFDADKKMQKNALEEQIKRIEEVYIPELEKALTDAQSFDMEKFKNQNLEQLLMNLKRGSGLNQGLIDQRMENGGNVMEDFFNGALARKGGAGAKNAQVRGWERDIEEQKRKKLQEENIRKDELKEAEKRLKAGRHLSKKQLELLKDEEKRKQIQVAQGKLQAEKDRKAALEKAKDALQKKTFEAHLDEMKQAQKDRAKMIQLLGNMNGNLPAKNELKNVPNINNQESQIDLDETNNILRDINRNKVTVWQGAK